MSYDIGQFQALFSSHASVLGSKMVRYGAYRRYNGLETQRMEDWTTRPDCGVAGNALVSLKCYVHDCEAIFKKRYQCPLVVVRHTSEHCSAYPLDFSIISTNMRPLGPGEDIQRTSRQVLQP